MAGTIVRPALILGAIGFSAGFFGPMILDPSSGNGPLLGLFITGPAGLVTGAAWGAFRSRRRHRSPGGRP